MRTRRVARGVAANVFDKSSIALVQLLAVPVFATRWGLAVYGGWVLLSTLPSFLAISDLGFATAAGTRMAMLVADGRRDEAVRVFQSAWVVILAASTAMIALALAATAATATVNAARSPTNRTTRACTRRVERAMPHREGAGAIPSLPRDHSAMPSVAATLPPVSTRCPGEHRVDWSARGSVDAIPIAATAFVSGASLRPAPRDDVGNPSRPIRSPRNNNGGRALPRRCRG